MESEASRHVDDNGVPIETAVLRRFWIQQHNGDEHMKQWTVGDVIRVSADGGGWRVWRVIGVFLGATHQEDVIELETLDRDRNTQGRMLVPRELLNASLGAMAD